MTAKAERPVRRDAPIVAHLKARGLCARLVVDRIDGAPLTEADVREADAALVAFEQADRRAWKAFAAANAATSKASKPPTTAKPRKAAPKRTSRAR